MLTDDIKNALKQYTEKMTSDVTLVLNVGQHEKRDELRAFLTEFASVSERITLQETRDDTLRSPLSFRIMSKIGGGEIVFSGIPSGHEFNSLVLAVLHSGGVALKLDQSITNIISKINQPLHFEVFVSLSCHNCPDVVQALNQFALVNSHIKTEMIDGGLFPKLIEARNIQGVPSVFLNGEPFANGKIDTAQIIEKLCLAYPQIKHPGASTQMPIQDVTVIGGGPSGVSAAIYAARKGLAVTLIADRFGGQVKDTMGIENLISVPKTTGPQLTGNLKEHLQSYDITLKEHIKVERVKTLGSDRKNQPKVIELSSGETFETKTVIIATGARWRELGVPGEKENVGKGVAYCPHCDGPFFKGKDVAVIGGGNSGIEAALDLAGIVKSVTVYEFMPELKADKVLVDAAKQRANIKFVTHAATTRVVAQEGKVTALEYQDRESGVLQRQTLAGIFVQIGLVPNSAFVKGVVEQTQFGEIIVNEKCQTSTEGIFACGDVTTVPYKQIVVALGEGAKAALGAFEYLLSLPQQASHSQTEAAVA